jgi:hypothetical protein
MRTQAILKPENSPTPRVCDFQWKKGEEPQIP